MNHGRQQAHERLGDLQVVVERGADERRHRARRAEREVAVRCHQPLLRRDIERDAAAVRLG